MSKITAICCFAALCAVARGQEPTGGVIKDLVFFQESLNDSIRWHTYSGSGPTVDASVRYAGTKSIKFVASSSYAGTQVFWAGNTNKSDWWGPPGEVFWPQANSRLQFWIYHSIAGNQVGIGAYAYQLYLGGVGAATIAIRNRWQFVDLPLPSNLIGQPLKGFEINFGNGTPTLYMDEFKITNVRMYAGSGTPPPANFDKIAASQIGYAPDMKKEFSSPSNFSSFSVVRISDNATVFSGGGPVRTVSSGVINNTTVYIGDFSALTVPGRYKIVAGEKESFPFTIGTNVFQGPLRAAQRFFYFQRAFTAVESPYAEGPWVHPSDAMKAPAGIVKGWHDAGDLTIYMPTMTQSLFWLLESWSDFRPTADDWNIPESGNGIPDHLDETRWGLEWVLSMQDGNGGFWGNTCAENGNYYPYGSSTPNTISGYTRTVAPTVQNTAKAVAVLAYASVVYREFDVPFADRCLAAARVGWTWMTANPNATNDGDVGSCGVYAQGNDAALLKTNRMWAAAGMLFATGEAQYENAFQANYTPIQWISSYNKSEAFAAQLYLRCTTGVNTSTQNSLRQAILQFADGVRSDGNAHPFGWATYYYWGALSNGAHRVGQFSWKAYLMDNNRTADRDQLLNQIHYMFGRNYRNIAYMSGADQWGATQWRREGFHHWMKTLQATPFHFPGAVAGGPNEAPSSNDISYPPSIYGYFGDPRYPRDGTTPIDGRYTDNDSWSTNEICINWQGAILYSLYAANMIAGGTVGEPDTVAPMISAIEAGNISASTATISWSTNEPATSVVEYGTTTALGTTASVAGYQTGRSVVLTGLQAGTIYYYRVKSADRAGNESVSAVKSLQTGISRTYAPSGAVILAGSVASGTYQLLSANDGQYLTINSTGSGNPRTMDWYGVVTIAEAQGDVRRLAVSYDGKYTRNNTSQQVYLYDWQANSWTQIDSRTVGGVDITVAYSTTVPTRFISSGGEIRLRVAASGPNSRACQADYMAFQIETAGAALSRRADTDEPRLMTAHPEELRLYQNYPNPFNPTTTITFDLPQVSHVRLTVYDMLGREIRSLLDGTVNAGRHSVLFDASGLASGSYIYRLEGDNGVNLKRMLLLK